MDQKNFIVAIVFSVLIIVGWQALFPPAKAPVQQQATTQSGALTQTQLRALDAAREVAEGEAEVERRDGPVVLDGLARQLGAAHLVGGKLG